MAVQSLFQQAKELETQVVTILSTHDIFELSTAEKQLINTIKHQLVDAKLDIREYEYAHTRVEQLKAAHEGKKRFEQVSHSIVKASEHNLFGAVDVAQLSARIELIISHLE